MAAIAPVGSSPVTGPATGCSLPCGARDSPTNQKAWLLMMALPCPTLTWWPQFGAPLRPTSPRPAERDACVPYLSRERSLLTHVRVIVALGQFAHQIVAGELGIRPRPGFGHGAEAVAPDGTVLLSSYHPSQRNTFTGTLTESMLDEVLVRAVFGR